jgi:hypothetical protein
MVDFPIEAVEIKKKWKFWRALEKTSVPADMRNPLTYTYETIYVRQIY